MDVQSAFQANLWPVLIAAVVLFLLWEIHGKAYRNKFGRLPPGPTPAPVVGNFFQVYVKEPYKYYIEVSGKKQKSILSFWALKCQPLKQVARSEEEAVEKTARETVGMMVEETIEEMADKTLSKKHGSVFTLWFGKTPVVVISGYQALKDSMIGMGYEFSGRANYPLLMKVSNGYGVLVSSGERWKQLRRFCLSTLKNFGMGRYTIEDKVKEEARHLVQTFSTFEDSAFNPKDLLYKAVCNVICSIMFGHRFESEDPQFKLLFRAVEEYFSILSSPLGQAYNIFPKFVGLFPGKLHDMFLTLEKTKALIKHEAVTRLKKLDTSSPPQDFIEAFLLQMEQEKQNPDTEYNFSNLFSTVWNLFSAGSETTSSTLRQSLLLMMRHPDIQARVQKEIDEVVGQDRCPSTEDRKSMPYTNAVIHEIQRYLDLTPTAVPHKMLCDTEYKSYFIPKGTMVLPLLSSVLSDPELWKIPDRFDPDNFLDEKGQFKSNDAFVVFGMGKRACLGEALARVELFIFFTSLLQHFTFRATQPPEEIDISPAICSFGRIPRSYECYAVRRA